MTPSGATAPYLEPFGAPDGERVVLIVGARNSPTGPAATTAGAPFPPRPERAAVRRPGPVLLRQLALCGRSVPRGAPRRLLLGWVLEAPLPVDTVPYWIGAHSIPRVMELAGEELVQSPVPELEPYARRSTVNGT